jgi:hypothetical protein
MNPICIEDITEYLTNEELITQLYEQGVLNG